MAKEIRKITYGFAIQKWNAKTKKFLGQEFVCGDQIDYENEKGKHIEETEPSYEPYTMIRCDTKSISRDILNVIFGDNELMDQFTKALGCDEKDLEATYQDLLGA